MESSQDLFQGAYIPGTASLIAEVDMRYVHQCTSHGENDETWKWQLNNYSTTQLEERVLVVLRDGRTLIGFLRSVDQFANLLLQDTIERIHVGKQYGDIPRGIFLIRGENMLLCGEIDSELESTMKLDKVSIDEILEAQRIEQEREAEEKQRKENLLRERGLPISIDIVDDTYS